MTAVSPPQRAWFSELSRDAKAVAAAADQGPVVIQRRAGADLILMRKVDADQERAGIDLAARVIYAAANAESGALAPGLDSQFPWISFLPEHERQLCARELLDSTRACASVTHFEPLVTVIHAWQSTAEAYSAGWRGDGYDWLTEPVAVPRPVVG